MVRNLRRRPTQKFDHGIIAQVELVRPLQIDQSRKRHHGREPPFVRC